MDKYDKQILAYLQEDADISLDELSKKVSLTKNPCWRRIQKLQQSGVIKKNVALLDATKINLGVTVFVHIRTNQHSAEWLNRFASVVDDIPEVIEFYRMSGDVDYIIKIMVPSINAYDDVYQKIIERVEISNVSSYFAMQELKNTTVLPLNY